MQAKRRFYVKKMPGGESGYAHQLKRINYSTSDQLAEEYIRSSDGYITTAASLGFFDAMLKSKGIDTQPKIINDLELANGKHVLLPAQGANIFYGWAMNEIDKINARQNLWRLPEYTVWLCKEPVRLTMVMSISFKTDLRLKDDESTSCFSGEELAKR
jgi:hypothetical protein